MPSAVSKRTSEEGGAAAYFDDVRAEARQAEAPTRSKQMKRKFRDAMWPMGPETAAESAMRVSRSAPEGGG